MKKNYKRGILHAERLQNILHELCGAAGLDYFDPRSELDKVHEDNALTLTVTTSVDAPQLRRFKAVMAKVRKIIGTHTVPTYCREEDEDIGTVYFDMEWVIDDVNALSPADEK